MRWFTDDGTERFAIVVDGRVGGTVQFAEENEPDYRHAGLDIFLDADHQGAGMASMPFGPWRATSSRSAAITV